MASTIKVDNIAPSAGGTEFSLTRGVAKAWVNFNGTGTIAVRDSENVSSITDNGTGDYSINFAALFANANYADIFSLSDAGALVQSCRTTVYAAATDSRRLECFDGHGTQDQVTLSADFKGDLA